MMREELYAAALRTVSERRQRAVTLAQQAREKAEEKLPQLRALENARTQAGIQTARLSASGAPQAEREAALREAQAAQAAIELLLQQNGIAPKTLAPQFTCPLCQDTGHTKSGSCQCVQELVRKMRRAELCEASPLTLCSFDTFDLSKYPETPALGLGVTMRAQMREIFSYCQAWAKHFTPHADSLYLCGYAGLGKTHLALSMANEVLRMGYDVVYLSAQEAFARVEKERFNDNSSETLSAMMQAELLILDDLGTEFLTPYVGACLYELVNTRCSRRLPTIYTSNIVNDADLARRYTEKIVSRLLGSCEALCFVGEDIRLQSKES